MYVLGYMIQIVCARAIWVCNTGATPIGNVLWLLCV